MVVRCEIDFLEIRSAEFVFFSEAKFPQLGIHGGHLLKSCLFIGIAKVGDPDDLLARVVRFHADPDKWTCLWDNHIKVILQEYLRGRRDANTNLEDLKKAYGV